MELWQAAALGVVQGLTEFLPVSSSGHLVLGQRLLGFTEPALMFDIAVHVGTLVAVVGVFWRDLWSIMRGLFVWRDGEGRQGRRLLWLVIVGSIPTAIMGFLLKDLFESMFSSLLTVGLALLVTGWLLLATALVRMPGRPLERVGAGRALLIGLAQGLAITPGISRSGSTIAMALLLGVNRRMAAHYSFVLSIPAILGALVLHVHELGAPSASQLAPMIMGFITAAISGYLALRMLLKIVQAGAFHWFAPYCFAVGLFTLAWNFWG
ncbi:MAG: undecaprenyl-diphosphatase UppP [Proteobacteria bacterium]|nr:undecaprenyl-diphosphatase UppP [Pseudomonadota bacterium]MBU1450429.1 undecaprenyl-diphosphatase UppP [Pseudomonadota bacterium]MBU2470387.1 undecaprenyl-diphosphatase UppP [Pseudomonadota bacterium]MBU2517749.1 undecaprenyl-diphosphatase UppP [Pseudomonadota bacterium]